MVLCHYINADSVVGIPWGGRDTQIPPYAKEFELFALTGSGDRKPSGTNARAIVCAQPPGETIANLFKIMFLI